MFLSFRDNFIISNPCGYGYFKIKEPYICGIRIFLKEVFTKRENKES